MESLILVDSGPGNGLLSEITKPFLKPMWIAVSIGNTLHWKFNLNAIIFMEENKIICKISAILFFSRMPYISARI